MTTINELQGIVENTRSLINRNEKLEYLNSQNRDTLNFLAGNIQKDGIAKAIASEIPISNKSESSMSDIVSIFELASTQSRRKDKIRLMKNIKLTSENRDFILTTLYGSLKLGLKIPIPDPNFGDIIKPQLCGTGIEFDLSKMIIEEKFDGIRCIATNNNEEIILQSRNGKILDIPVIREYLITALPPGTTVDGEIVASDGDFQSLDRKSNNLIYQIFDIIFYDEKPIIEHSLLVRKEILYEYIKENSHINISDELNFDSIADIDNWIIKTGAEGIVAKYINSNYNYGNRKDWIKYKHFRDITCEVVGFTSGEGKRDRDDMIGAIKVIPEGFTTITKVGSGFTDAQLIEMRQLIDANKKIMVDVKYQNFTSDNKSLRFPIFLKIREISGDEI